MTTGTELDANASVNDVLQHTLASWKAHERWPRFYDIYKDLHMNPGVSGQEDYACNVIEKHLSLIKNLMIQKSPNSAWTMKIHRDIGKTGCGPSVVGVLSNPSDGSPMKASHPQPVVLLRADTDALPVLEATGAEYASKVTGVMHACGHDMHISALLAAMHLLLDASDKWSGTILACFQPGEEKGTGAKAMIDDGLYQNYGIPTPDFVYGGHVTPEPAGLIGLTPGTAFSKADSWQVTLKGRGGHASKPEATIDPIVMAAYAITRLQTVVSRKAPSQKAAVLTVSQINAGDAENIIPDTCTMKVNMRANTDHLSHLMELEMRHILACEVRASNPDAQPDMTGHEPEREDANPRFTSISHLPLLENKGQIADDIRATFATVFGDHFNPDLAPASGSEDFSHLAKSKPDLATPDIPYVYWRYGGTSREVVDRAGGDWTKVPYNHSALFLPQLKIERDDDTMKVGASALFVAALSKCLLAEGGKVVARL